MLTVSQSMALRYHSGEISSNEYALIYEAHSSAGLLQEGLIRKAKERIVDIVQVAAGAGAIVATGGAGGDTITDSLIAVETSASTLDTIIGLASDAMLFKELYNSAKDISLDSGLGAIYTAVENIMFKLSERFENIEDFLNEQRDKLLEFIDTLVNSAVKWVSAMLPDDAGIAGVIIKEAVSWAIRNIVENPYTHVRNIVEQKLPPHLQNMLFDEEYAIDWFQVEVVDALADFLDERAGKQGQKSDDPWKQFTQGSESTSFLGKGYDWGRNYINMVANPTKTYHAIASDIFDMHPDDMQEKLDSGEISAEEFNKGIAKFEKNQNLIGNVDYANPNALVGKMASASLDKIEQVLPDYLRNTIRPKVPAAVKTARFIIALLFGSLAALQITIKGDYTDANEVKEEDLTPKQRAYIDEIEKDVAKKGGSAHPLMRNILLNTMGLKDPTGKGYRLPNPEELQDKYPALNAKESKHILDGIKKATEAAGQKKLAAGNFSRERSLRLNIQKMILESEGYELI